MRDEKPDRLHCFEDLGEYHHDKYELRHGPGCGPNHEPGDPVYKSDDYFPLNLTQDPHARTALMAYAASVSRDNPDLALNLQMLLGTLAPVDPERARQAAVALSLHANLFEAARISAEGGG